MVIKIRLLRTVSTSPSRRRRSGGSASKRRTRSASPGVRPWSNSKYAIVSSVGGNIHLGKVVVPRRISNSLPSLFVRGRVKRLMKP